MGKLASYIDNINCIKSQNEIQRYYFTRMQSMTLEKISNTHTGYISKLINKVCDLFFNTIWEIESSIISTIIGAISILYMVCKQSIYTGIICVSISVLAVYLKYKMLKNKQKLTLNLFPNLLIQVFFCKAAINDLTDGQQVR